MSYEISGKGFVIKPKFTVRLLRAAEEDLTDILEYIAADNATAVESTLDRIEKDLQHLTRQPYLGRIPQEEELVGMGYRVLIVLDHLVFYTLEERSVLVHRILHGARDYLQLL